MSNQTNPKLALSSQANPFQVTQKQIKPNQINYRVELKQLVETKSFTLAEVDQKQIISKQRKLGSWLVL